MIEWVRENFSNQALLSTAILVGILFLARLVVVRRVRAAKGATAEMRRRWIVQVRQVSLLLFALGILYIWGSELREFALSLVAITAALVIATKELLMCASGAILKSSSRAFSIGDRIEVNNLRGDVFDHTLLTTTLLEVGPGKSTHQHTGRTVVVPNSLFLTSTIINETFTDDYVLHVFSIPLKRTDDWKHAEELLLRFAREECSSYLDDARRHMEKVGETQGIENLSVEPRVTLQVTEPEVLLLLVRIPALARRKGRIEQNVVRRFMETFYSKAAPVAAGGKETGDAVL